MKLILVSWENASCHLLLLQTTGKKPSVRINVKKNLETQVNENYNMFLLSEFHSFSITNSLLYSLGTFLKAWGCLLATDVDIYKQRPSSLNYFSQIKQRIPKKSSKCLQSACRYTLRGYRSLNALPMDLKVANSPCYSDGCYCICPTLYPRQSGTNIIWGS